LTRSTTIQKKIFKPEPLGKIYFTCSFDDGDVADLRLADLLNKYKLKGTLYIPQTCSLVSESLNEQQIKSLSGVVEIGGHTISHQVLTDATPQQARDEIVNCKKWLENVTGKSIHSFCPPTGRFNRGHVLAQQQAGFTTMRTVEMLAYSLKGIKETDGIVVLPTTSQVYNHKKIAYQRNRFKRFKFGYDPVFKKLFNADWEIMSNNYITYLHEASKSGNEAYYFHLWGHSWEIEKYALWKSLERIFQKLSEIEELITCDNNELAAIVRLRINNE
jgi:peptidoglycan/xylan/chitin deacetylase (PgdA/CDA1 family)